MMKFPSRWRIGRWPLILLIAIWVAILGVFCIWWRQQSEQKQIVTELQKYGAEVTWSPDGVQSVQFASTKRTLGNEELRLVRGLPNLSSLNLRNTNVSDAGLVHLKDLNNIRFLVLPSRTISIQSIQMLKKELPDTLIVNG